MAKTGTGMTAGEAHRAMAALPVAGLPTILGGRSPLVLAPHPDDESLGCGGLLAASAAAGLQPAVLVMTDGGASHPNSVAFPAERVAALRAAEARAAVAELGVAADRIGFVGLRDAASPQCGPAFDAAVAAIMAAARRWGSGTLLAPWRHDPHWDHYTTHRMAVAAAAQAGLEHLAYPVWGWTLPAGERLEGPAPSGWRLDISAQRAAKQRAIAAHRTQHGGIIQDDPEGFQLPAAFLALFGTAFETFLDRP